MAAGLADIGGSTTPKVVRWQTIGNTMYGYDASGRLVATKKATVTALPISPKTPTYSGSGATGMPSGTSYPKTVYSGSGAAGMPAGTGGARTTQNTVKATTTSGGSKVSTPTTTRTVYPGDPVYGAAAASGATTAGGVAPVGSAAGSYPTNVPMPNPGGFLGQVPNFEAMMGTYQQNPQAWLEKVFQLQGLDPLGRNYAMAQAAAPYFAGMQFLAPFMSTIGTGNFNPDNASASAASMLNWVANAAGRPGAAAGMPGAAGIFGNLAQGIGNNQSALYDLLIGQMGVDEQASVLNDLIASMGMTGSLAGPWAAAMQNRLGRLGSEYQLAMGDATTQNPLGPLVEYFLRSVGQPNARAAASNLIP